MNFKKRVNGSWDDTPHYIHNTSTDAITTLPADIYADGTNATVGLKGNMVQTGRPTSDNPVMPQGTGERTGNLIDVANLSNVRWAQTYPLLLTAINSLPNGVYTMSISFELTSRDDTTDSSVCGWYIAQDSRVLSNIRRSWETAQIGEIITVVDTFTIDDDNRGAFTALYLYGCGISDVGATGSANAENIMLNTGSTALPYEPYGYKILISSASTTTPVYLGEVETTRTIKKLVLTGEESGWKKNIMTSSNAFYRTISGYYHYRGYCTHYATVYGTQAAEGVFFGSNINFLTALSDNIDTIDKWKNYLRQQYAAGTPVTVWYVLATETTGIINEPLMKIGDYVDTLSMEQAGVQIPTANGSNTLDVETTVKPSEIYIKYRGWAVAALSSLSAEVSSPEGTPEEVNPEETEETENGSEDISLQHEFEAIE